MARKLPGQNRGEGQFGLILGIAVIVLTVIVGLKVLPIHIHGNEVLDVMSEQANFGGLKSDEKIQYEVFRKAQEVGVPLPLKEIKVSRRGSSIIVAAKYEQSVEIFGYKYTYKFDRVVEKPIF